MDSTTTRAPALDGLAALRAHGKTDLISGFLVFLIALPLCLGIALASGFPPIAGVLTAIVSGLVVSFLSGAPLTIKGPAAGLIAIAVAAVGELGGGDATLGYRRALAVVVAAGVVQVVFGLVRAGRLGDFFPGSAVHGMLAAIGVIIMSKQIHKMVGVDVSATEPLELLAEVPHSLAHMNPHIALIGAVSFAILFVWPMFKHPLAKKVPAPMVVLLVAVPLGMVLGLDQEHAYTFAGAEYTITPRYLVNVPNDITTAIVFPDFSVVTSAASLKYIAMFSLVGTLESLLTVRAIDGLDPDRGRSLYDRDIVAIGVGNTISGLLGGLPMISEIVRSKANLDNGVKSRFANFFHGVFLLFFVGLLPGLVHRVPVAALGAMLVYTGTRLASPHEFVHAWTLGRDQIAVFVTTLVVTLATDLLVGVGLGILLELLIHVIHGAGVSSLFRVTADEARDERTATLTVRSSATFSSYLSLKGRILAAAATHEKVIVDLSAAPLVDHTTQERLHDLAAEFEDDGKSLVVRGLDAHRVLGGVPTSLRKRIAAAA